MKLQFPVPVSPSRVRGIGSGREHDDADRLYKAAYVHHSWNYCSGSSGDCHGGKCNVRKLVQRPDRNFSGPVVHYGVIALGNTDFESGVERDQAKEALGVICFEREAASLMNNFPCVVICGICNYADSRKNARW